MKKTHLGHILAAAGLGLAIACQPVQEQQAAPPVNTPQTQPSAIGTNNGNTDKALPPTTYEPACTPQTPPDQCPLNNPMIKELVEMCKQQFGGNPEQCESKENVQKLIAIAMPNSPDAICKAMYVTAPSGMNLRKDANQGSPIVGNGPLKYNEKVEVITTQDKWAQVIAQGTTGWVFKNYLSCSSPAVAVASGSCPGVVAGNIRLCKVNTFMFDLTCWGRTAQKGMLGFKTYQKVKTASKGECVRVDYTIKKREAGDEWAFPLPTINAVADAASPTPWACDWEADKLDCGSK